MNFLRLGQINVYIGVVGNRMESQEQEQQGLVAPQTHSTGDQWYCQKRSMAKGHNYVFTLRLMVMYGTFNNKLNDNARLTGEQ